MRMQRKDYSREEKFIAHEKHVLGGIALVKILKIKYSSFAGVNPLKIKGFK